MQPKLIAFSYFAYILVGTVITILGPLVPEITTCFGVGYRAIGAVMIWTSLAYLPAVLLGGFLCGRYGTRKVNVAGLLGMALGYCLISLADKWWLFVVGSCLGGGLGFGLVETGLNALVMDVSAGRGGAALNLLHVFAAIGAVLGPVLARGVVAASGRWQLVYLILSVTFLLGAGALLLLRLPRASSAAKPSEQKAPVRGLFSPVVAMLAASMTFYVGAEIGLSNWMYSYIISVVGGSALLGASLNSLFWLGLGLGRLVAAHLSERLGYERCLFLGSLSACVVLLPGLLWRQPLVVTLSFFLTGLLSSGTFPTILAVGGKSYPHRKGPVAGVLIFFAGLGTMIFPPAMGYLADVRGIAHAMILAFASLSALAVVTAFLAFGVSASTRTDSAPSLNQ